ncbi:MAG: GC-type dockerin domain-anchored protein [Phycisphaerales bacterium JB040]
MAVRLVVLLAILGHACVSRASGGCADVNDDSVVDNADIQAFVEAYLAGDASADWNSDGVLDNADIGAFVDDFLNADCDLPRLQDFRGALRLDGPTGDAIVTSGPVASPGASNTVLGSIGGSTGGWCAMRLRPETDPKGAGPFVVLALGDGRRNAVPEVFGVRITTDGSAIGAYLRDVASGEWRAIGVVSLDGWAVGSERWFCWVWDASGLDTDRFPGAGPGATAAAYTWSESRGLVAEGRASVPFTAIGRAGESEQSPFFWRVGSEVAGGPVLDLSEVAVAGALDQGVSEQSLAEIASGALNPCAVEGITHVWALDRRHDMPPAGDEVERMDLVNGAHLSGVGAGVVWTPDVRGPAGQSAGDPLATPPERALIEGDVDGVRALIDTRDYDVWQFSDSFGVDWIPARFWHAMTGSLDRMRYPVIGWSSGFRIGSGGRPYSTLSAEIDSSIPFRHVAAVVGPRTYHNGFEDGTRAVGFPTDASVEFAGPLAFPQQQALRMRAQPLYAGTPSGTMSGWLDGSVPAVATRTLVHNSGAMSFTLRQGQETPRDMGGAWAMPRWSDGQDPFTSAPRTPDATETLTWMASDHAPEPIVGGRAEVSLSSTDLPDGEFLGIAGWSVHTLNPDGSPVDRGVHYASFSIASQSIGALATSQAPATFGVKQFADTELLNVVNGVTWARGRRLLVVMDIADLMPDRAAVELWMLGDGSPPGGARDEHRNVGFLNRVRWAAEAVGYAEVRFLLVSNFMHTYAKETDLFRLRQDHLATEENLRHVALSEPDVALLSVFRFLDGALGVATDGVTRLSSSPSVYASVGWPHREARYLHRLLWEREGIQLQQGGDLLDTSGLHTDPSASGLADWNRIGHRIWSLLLATP